MPCTASTSSVCSPYQPGASHSLAAVPEKLEARSCVYWPAANGLSPVTPAYSFASPGMVGEA